jgi:hypothetical protein
MRRDVVGVPLRGAAILAVVLVAAALAASGSAAPPETPDLARMALGVADLPAGAKVKRQGYVRDEDFVASYEREFKSGVRLGRSRADLLESDIALTDTADEAASYFAGVAVVFRTKKGRALLAKQLLGELPKDTPKGTFKITFGKVRSLGVGDNSLVAPITFTFLGIVRVQFVFAFVRTDKVIASLDVGGFVNRPIAVSDVARMAKAVAGHIQVGLVPANSSPPTISGTAQSGATIAVANGLWSNTPSSFVYRWLRCDASGANCQSIANAAAQTYVVTDADVGSTLRAEVTAANGPARSQPIQSAQTPVVTPAVPGPPPAPGTTAQVERIAVCPAADTSVIDGRLTTCNKDWSATGIPAGGQIYCTVEISDGLGANVSLSFVSGTSTVSQGPSLEIGGSDWFQWAWYGPFTSGAYACNLSINGSVVARLPFTVGA